MRENHDQPKRYREADDEEQAAQRGRLVIAHDHDDGRDVEEERRQDTDSEFGVCKRRFDWRSAYEYGISEARPSSSSATVAKDAA